MLEKWRMNIHLYFATDLKIHHLWWWDSTRLSTLTILTVPRHTSDLALAVTFLFGAESMWFIGRASERGIHVWGSIPQNFFFVPCSRQDRKRYLSLQGTSLGRHSSLIECKGGPQKIGCLATADEIGIIRKLQSLMWKSGEFSSRNTEQLTYFPHFHPPMKNLPTFQVRNMWSSLILFNIMFHQIAEG